MYDLEADLKPEKIGYSPLTSFFAVAPIRIARRFFTSTSQKSHSDTTTLPPSFINKLLKFCSSLKYKFQPDWGCRLVQRFTRLPLKFDSYGNTN